MLTGSGAKKGAPGKHLYKFYVIDFNNLNGAYASGQGQGQGQGGDA